MVAGERRVRAHRRTSSTTRELHHIAALKYFFLTNGLSYFGGEDFG